MRSVFSMAGSFGNIWNCKPPIPDSPVIFPTQKLDWQSLRWFAAGGGGFEIGRLGDLRKGSVSVKLKSVCCWEQGTRHNLEKWTTQSGQNLEKWRATSHVTSHWRLLGENPPQQIFNRHPETLLAPKNNARSFIIIDHVSFQALCVQVTRWFAPSLYPKDPAVLKRLRIVNLLRVVNLLSRCDLLSWPTLCGHHFPGNYRHFSSQRRVCGVVNTGGVLKIQWRSNLLFFYRRSTFSTEGSFG